MNKKFKAIVSAAMFAFVLAILAPAGADAARVSIRDNGNASENKVKIREVLKKKVRQHNWTYVTSGTAVAQNTGENETNKNTGDGDVDNTTGDAIVDVLNETTTAGNEAEVDFCGCVNDDEDHLVIKGNGNNSENKIRVSRRSYNRVSQSNGTKVSNYVHVTQNTGGNSANKNTGDGAVDVNTGDGTVIVTNNTHTGGNHLNTTE